MSILDLFKNLTGKTALVTGARRGLGQGMAIALAEAGADIIAVSKPGDDRTKYTRKAVHAAGRHFNAYDATSRIREAVYDLSCGQANQLR